MHKCKQCKHENIKFCSMCQKPYCGDCGKEWGEECTRNHWDYYISDPWYPSTINPDYTTTTITYDTVFDSATCMPDTNCSHN